MADDDIDTRVSPALDPERFRLMDGYGDDTRQFVDVVINAYSDVYQVLGKVHDLRRLWDNNPAVTQENRTLIVARESAKQKEAALTRLARAERDLRANITYTEGELSRPLKERAGLGSLNGEVRAYVAKLDRKGRSAFMAEALERGDEPTLEAVLGAQPFLSGLTQVDHEHYTRTYHEKKNPHLVRRLDLMRRFLEEIERNTPIVHAQFEKAVGAKPSVVAQLKSLDDQAQAALAELKAKRT
jgi:hypothetical protein